MTKITGIKPIEFIQGDSYTHRINVLDSEILGAISKITFTCKRFNICADYVKEGTLFIFNMPKEIGYGKTTFDITIKFVDDKDLSSTGNIINIKERNNYICEVRDE